MSEMDTKFQNTEFRNWITACLALKCIRDALIPVVEKYSNDQFLTNASEVKRLCNVNEYACSQCDVAVLEPFHKRSKEKCTNKQCTCRKPNIKQCPAGGSCGKIYDLIQAAHKDHAPKWSNTNSDKWCKIPWEQMKCFIYAKGYQKTKDISEADLTALVQICSNHVSLYSLFGAAVEDLNKVQKRRNKIFHSSTMRISDDKLNRYISHMKTFLNLGNFKDFQKVFDLQKAELQKLESQDIDMKDALVVIKQVIKEVNDSIEGMREKQKQNELDIDQLLKAMQEQEKTFQELKAHVEKSEQQYLHILCLPKKIDQIDHTCKETFELTKQIGTNTTKTNEKLDVLIQGLQDLKQLFSAQMHPSQPETKLDISTLRAEHDRSMTEKMLPLLREIIFDITTEPREPKYAAFRQRCEHLLTILQEGGNTIVGIHGKCIELYIKSPSLESLILLCENYLNGSIVDALLPVQDILRKYIGCEDLTLTLTLDKDNFIRAVRYITDKTRESSVSTDGNVYTDEENRKKSAHKNQPPTDSNVTQALQSDAGTGIQTEHITMKTSSNEKDTNKISEQTDTKEIVMKRDADVRDTNIEGWLRDIPPGQTDAGEDLTDVVQCDKHEINIATSKLGIQQRCFMSGKKSKKEH